MYKCIITIYISVESFYMLDEARATVYGLVACSTQVQIILKSFSSSIKYKGKYFEDFLIWKRKNNEKFKWLIW